MATAVRTIVRPRARLPATRMVEWSILVLVILVVAAVAGKYVRVLQAQAERSAVLSTLGALRTGLVIAHLQGPTAADALPSSGSPPNPFTVLKVLPPNYRGELSLTDLKVAPKSGWVFDLQSGCVGYTPLDAGWSEGASQADTWWFNLVSSPGPRQLIAQSVCTWRGVMAQ